MYAIYVLIRGYMTHTKKMYIF